MPRDASGIYSLPAGYLAETGDTILASQHNPPLEDLASSMTNSLPRSGAAPMTAALKLFDGTVSAPGMAFNTATGTGFYKTTAGFAVAIGGVQVAEFGAGGIISGAVPIGAGMDWWLPTAPAGWVFPYGQACTTAYPILRQKFIDAGNPFGVSGSDPLFPDKRNLMSIPKGDMGGVDAAGVTTAGSGIDGKTLGAHGGAQSVTVLQANLPAASLVTTIPAGQGSHIHEGGVPISGAFSGSGSGGVTQAGGNTTLTILSATLPAMSGTTPLGGSGTALNKMPPGIVCNYIMFAGA